MKEEISRLFDCLQKLVGSCADHEITTDIFVSPADRREYCSALDGIRTCCEKITASGINREHLLPLFTDKSECSSPLLDGFAEPEDLVPLIATAFTPVQEDIIGYACDEWAFATAPGDPGTMRDLIRSSIHPLTLATVLSPEATGMLRFPTLLQLQTAGKRNFGLVRPLWDTRSCIFVPATDDPAEFSGQLNVAIYWFLSGKGMIQEICLPEILLQALFDLGVLREGGAETLIRISNEEAPVIQDLLQEGSALSGDIGAVTDIRTLLRIILTKTSDLKPGKDIGTNIFTGIPESVHRIEQLGGHLLAGIFFARGEAPDRIHIGPVLNFMYSVAALPFGRGTPGPVRVRELERAIQEQEQLIWAVAGDYSWRAVPMPPRTGGYRPLVDLWPDRHLVLYDREEMAYRSPDAFKALVMEAWYRHRYGTREPAGSNNPDHEKWFDRLLSVLSIPRVIGSGSRVHPGVAQWMDRLYREEYDPVNRIVDTYRVNRMSLPDQYLEAAVFEGRTGIEFTGLHDVIVKNALEETSKARKKLGDSLLPEKIYNTIIRKQIWPVFRTLCECETKAGTVMNAAPGLQGKGARGPQLTPRGTSPRVDTSVPNAHQPGGNLTGKAIKGTGASLLEEEGLIVPGGRSGPGAPAPRRGTRQHDRNALSAGDGRVTASCPFPGSQGSNKGGVNGSGIPDAADQLMKACAKSGELLDRLSSPDNTGNNRNGEGGEQNDRDQRETFNELRDFARRIDTLADSLAEKVRSSRGEHDREIPGETPPARIPDRGVGPGDETDELLKISKTLKKAAREYRKALEKVEHKLDAPVTDQGAIRHLTGMTKKAFQDLQQAGAEFQRLSGGQSPDRANRERLMVPLPESDNEPDPGEMMNATRRGRLEPSFVADTGYTPGVWESLSYFDASFDDGTQSVQDGPSSGRNPEDTAERRFEQNAQVLTREAEIYLSTLRQRTRSEWETIDEKAERIRNAALFESHTVSQDDYSTYQKFYQPVAGLVGVARKNIQQALQKARATRDLNELITGDDIDEENLAAVRTTMRIFRDRGREPDKTRWCISLLIDASSSMHDETVAKKLQATIQTAILFGEAVNRVKGISFEIAAFSDTEYIPLKRYRDDWNIRQGCYLIRQVIQATGGTNDVGAVSGALDRMNRLRTATGANRMIFVISDGQSGVGGREQMRKILSTNKDTRIFGWGIGPDMEKIEETYRPYGTWVRDIADLPKSMGEVLRRELGRPAMTGWKEERSDPGSDQETQAPEGLCTD